MSDYESKDVESLGDIAAIQKRSGMYIGDTTDPRQLVVEATDNSFDEEQAGYSKNVIIKYNSKTGMYSVRDFGRGIPIGKSSYIDSISNEKHDVETIQLLFTKTHSGAKFGDSDSYKRSRGLHGVGLKALNALSTTVKAVTHRNSKAVELDTKDGLVTDLKYYDTKEPDGLYVEFYPSPKYFDTVKVPKNELLEICSIPHAFGLHVDLYIDDQLQKLNYDNLFDLLPTEQEENELMRTEFKIDLEDSMVVALKYTSATYVVYRGYSNMMYNQSGGTHIRFFEDAYKQAWSKYLTDGFKIQDVLVGLRALVGVSIDNDALAFAGQVKERLTTPKAHFEPFRDPLVKAIQDYFDSHETERKGLIKRFEQYRAAQNKMLASKELSSLIYINDNTTGQNIRRKSVVNKLRECTSRDRKGTRLYIVEGDSAGGSYVQARDVKYHAILPIRGKIMNVSKRNNSMVACMKNAEIASIVNSAGTGIGDDCDASKSRYEMYCIATDSDADGLNISSLLIAIFVNLLPDLVKKGMVYVVRAPLYGWTDSTGKHYTNELKDVTNLNTLHRYKGLGEMDPDELRETCIDNPHLVRVEYPSDLDSFNKTMVSSSFKYQILEAKGKVKEISI